MVPNSAGLRVTAVIRNWLTVLPRRNMDSRMQKLLAAPIMMSSLVMNNILRYEGKANFAMIGLVTGGVLNIVLDPIFMFGLGLGTAGAGIATALSQSISFCILLSMFLRGKTVSQFRIAAVTREAREFGMILVGGAPSFGRQGLQSIGGMLLNIAASSYGDAAVAGMSIVSRIFMFIISVAIGVGQGFSRWPRSTTVRANSAGCGRRPSSPWVPPSVCWWCW